MLSRSFVSFLEWFESKARRILIGVIRVYQWGKPWLDVVVRSVFGYASECKHSPSCSNFTIEQIKEHGTITGLKNGLRQLRRCR